MAGKVTFQDKISVFWLKSVMEFDDNVDMKLDRAEFCKLYKSVDSERVLKETIRKLEGKLILQKYRNETTPGWFDYEKALARAEERIQELLAAVEQHKIDLEDANLLLESSNLLKLDLDLKKEELKKSH